MKSTKVYFALVAILFSLNAQSQTLAWVKQIHPYDYDIRILSSDSYLNVANVICGEFRDSVYFGFSPGLNGENNPGIDPKVFIVKTDYDGNYLWHKLIDKGMITETRFDNAGNILLGFRHSSNSLDIDPGPGVVTVSNGGAGYQHVLIKLSANGDYVWHKVMPIGGSSYMNFEVTPTNDVVVTGDFSSSLFYAGQSIPCWGVYNTFILEVDASGAENWVKRIGGTSASSFSSSQAGELDLDAAGNIYIVGEIEGTIDFDPSASSTTLSANSNYKFFLAKYTSTGNFVFVTDQGSIDNANLHDMVVNAAGEAHLTMDYNPTINPDQGFMIRKCTSAGATAWEHIYLNTDINTFAYAIECDASGNTYMAGQFVEDSLDLDPTAGTDYMVLPNPPLNTSKGFVVKFGPSGQYIWSYHLDHQALYGSVQTITNFNNLKMVEPNSLFVTNERGGATLFKLAVNGNLAISSIDQHQLISVYPNPNAGEFYVDQAFDNAQLEIFDLSGTLVESTRLTNSHSKLTVNLSPGTYLYRINHQTGRFIIQ